MAGTEPRRPRVKDAEAPGAASITASAIQHAGRPAHFFLCPVQIQSRENARYSEGHGAPRGNGRHLRAHVADAMIEAPGASVICLTLLITLASPRELYSGSRKATPFPRGAGEACSLGEHGHTLTG